MVCLPSKVTEPVRFSTMPMTDFRVVVLPAPLRPKSVTSSPRPISKPTPWRMCDSPYQACRFSTLSSGSLSTVSAMPRPDIGFDHGRIFGHRRVRALGQDRAARQHGDGVGEIGDDGHVVLDHQYGAVTRNRADERGDALDVLLPQARHGLV